MKKRLLMLMAFVAVMISCSKDDGNDGPDEVIGGEAFTSQAVKIQIPEGTELGQQVYDGTINGIPVKLIKAPGNILVFYLPSDIAPGEAELVIPALSNLTVDYNIQQTVLNGTADVVMEGYFEHLDMIAQNLDDSPEAQSLRHNIENFGDIYENASAADKTEMALAYQANKADFDALLSFNAGRSDNDAVALVANIALGTVAVAKGGALFVAATASAPIILGLVTVAAGGYLINRSIDDFFGINVVKEAFSFAGLIGSTDRVQPPAFTHNVARTISFEAQQREMSQADSGRSDEHTAAFFDAYNSFNNYVDLANAKIETVNGQVNSADLNPIEEPEFPGNASVLENIDSETFDNMTLSVAHPNVILEEKSLLGNGQLKLKFKITGNPTNLPIETYLNYTFDNGFSSFTGKVPIVVGISLEGSWSGVEIEGLPIGSWINYYDQSCPNIVTFQDKWLDRTLTFTENTFSFSGNTVTRNLNKMIQTNDCTVVTDGPDTEQQGFDEETGTYILNGTLLTIVTEEDNEEVTATIEFITPDKIKIGNDIYKRQ